MIAICYSYNNKQHPSQQQIPPEIYKDRFQPAQSCLVTHLTTREGGHDGSPLTMGRSVQDKSSSMVSVMNSRSWQFISSNNGLLNCVFLLIKQLCLAKWAYCNT